MSIQFDETMPRKADDWQSSFLAMLPAITRQARRLLVRVPRRDREEALHAIVASAAVTYARLVQQGKAQRGYSTPLASFGYRQYCAGRIIGSRTNSRDVGSRRCQRRRGCVVERVDDWREVLTETRRATPAEIATLRVDFSDWLQTLSPRDRRLANAFARGEQAGSVAKLLRLSAGRVSQLRQQLYLSWKSFLGEPIGAAG